MQEHHELEERDASRGSGGTRHMVVGVGRGDRRSGDGRRGTVGAWPRAGGRGRRGAGERGAHHEHVAVVGDGGGGTTATIRCSGRRPEAAGSRERASRLDSARGKGEEVEAQLMAVAAWASAVGVDGEVRRPERRTGARQRLGLGFCQGEGESRGGGESSWASYLARKQGGRQGGVGGEATVTAWPWRQCQALW